MSENTGFWLSSKIRINRRGWTCNRKKIIEMNHRIDWCNIEYDPKTVLYSFTWVLNLRKSVRRKRRFRSSGLTLKLETTSPHPPPFSERRKGAWVRSKKNSTICTNMYASLVLSLPKGAKRKRSFRSSGLP